MHLTDVILANNNHGCVARQPIKNIQTKLKWDLTANLCDKENAYSWWTLPWSLFQNCILGNYLMFIYQASI